MLNKKNINFIQLKKDRFGRYVLLDYGSDVILNLLTMVFNEPLGISSIEGFLLRCERDETCDGENFETFYAELAPDNKLVIGDLFADEDNPNEIEIDKDILLDLFKRYEELVKKNPSEIIITREGDKYMLEGKFF